jgi:hypothetical protein
VLLSQVRQLALVGRALGLHVVHEKWQVFESGGFTQDGQSVRLTEGDEQLQRRQLV